MSELLTRLRINFGKNTAARFTSHLDLFRAWERTFRRAGVQLAYRQGFNPQPRMNIASALPLGCTSQAEILDVWIENNTNSTTDFLSIVSNVLPPGLQIYGAQEVSLTDPALQTQIETAEYRLTFLEPIPNLKELLASLLAKVSVLRQWRGKTYDLRPLIRKIAEVEVDSRGHQTVLVEVCAQEGATGRPDEVISALGIKNENTLIHRTQLTFCP